MFDGTCRGPSGGLFDSEKLLIVLKDLRGGRIAEEVELRFLLLKLIYSLDCLDTWQ
jgi:hypothetical protein